MAAAVLALLLPGRLAAQTVAPAETISPQTMSPDTASAATAPGEPPAPPWAVTPRISLQTGYNDNIFMTNTDRVSDLVTVITPGISVRGDLPRVQVKLEYAPTATVYASNPSQNILGQNLDAIAQASLVPEWLFVDARGFAGLEPISGGFSPNSSVQVPRQNQTQVMSFAISPYLMHRFGDAGVGLLSYTLAQTNFSNSSASPSAIAPVPPPPGQNTLTQDVRASFTTGPDFGRLRNVVLVDVAQYTGSGVLSNAHNYIVTNDAAYALNRFLAVIGEIGYQDFAYGGTTPIAVKDVVWALGAKVQPNALSSIQATYGHRDGFDSLGLNAAYHVTQRTTLFANYAAGIGTDTLGIQQNLAISDIDLAGNSINAETGAPLPVSNAFFGVQQSLFKFKTFSLTARTELDRDTVSVSVSAQDQTLLSEPVVGASSSQRGVIGSVTWTHDLRHDLSATLYADLGYLQYYGSTQPGAFGTQNQHLVDFSLSLNYTFTPALTGTVQYIFTNRNSNDTFPGANFYQDVFLVGLTKTF